MTAPADIVERLDERIGVVHSHYISDDMQTLMDAKAEIESLRSSNARLSEALGRIDVPRDCGCRPCVGQCTSREALLIEVDAIKDIARTALSGERKGESAVDASTEAA